MTALRGAVKITLRPFKVGACCFEIGDQFDPSTSSLNDREKARLDRFKFVCDFTPEAYRNAARARPGGGIGRGWSPEFLYATGALERPVTDQQPPTAEFVPTTQDEVYLGYILRCRRFGNFCFVTVYAPNGERMAEKEFKSLNKAHEFVDTLPPVSTDSGGQGIQGDNLEDADDHDLQSSAVG